MRLISLKLKNFRQFKEAQVEFPDGVIGICGLNGVGKTTLIEGIAFCLYGIPAIRTGKEGIRRSSAPPAANLETTLEIEISGNIYTICRMLKGTSQTGTASLISKGKLIAESIKGVDKEITYLLGMDYSSFITSFYAKQKELNALSDLQPNQRKDIIMKMLQIDEIDKAIDKVRSNIRAQRTESEIKKRGLKNTDFSVSEKTGILIKLKEEKKNLVQIENTCQQAENELNAFKKKFAREREIYNTYHELDKKKTAVSTRFSGISKREKEIRKDLEETRQILETFPEIEKQYLEYEKLKEDKQKAQVIKESRENFLKNKIEELQNEYQEITGNEKKLKPGQPCPTCGRSIASLTTIREHFILKKEKNKNETREYEIELELLRNIEAGTKIKKEAAGVKKFEAEKYLEITGKIKILEKPHREYPLLSARLENRQLLEKTLTKILADKKEHESELAEIEKELKFIPYDKGKYENLEQEYDQARVKLEKSFSARNKLKLEIAEKESRVKILEREIEQIEISKQEIENILKDQETQNRLNQLLVEYRTHLISRIRPQLSENAGSLFAQLTNGKYSGIELDEIYDMYICEGGTRYPLERFSGGEADLANLCLRLSISQLIAASVGVETGFIILDEIFGSQDTIRKSAILEALAVLSKQFRQIILITHVEDIKDTLEHIIEVFEDEKNLSRIRQS